MYKTIQMLEMIGQNSSIKQYETVHEMLVQENISEAEINELIESNIPLICAWIPQDDEKEKEEDDDNGDRKEKDH